MRLSTILYLGTGSSTMLYLGTGSQTTSLPFQLDTPRQFCDLTRIDGRITTFMDIIAAVRPNVLPMDTTW